MGVTVLRRAGGVVACLVLGAAGVLATAAPAYADGRITSPTDGEVVERDGVVHIRATVDRDTVSRTDLRLAGPGDTQWQVVDSAAAGRGGELSYELFTDCAAYPSGPCAQRNPARNGVWTVSLDGGAEDERTFVVRIPPRVPDQVQIKRVGDRVVVTWYRGVEPDLLGWALYDERGRVALRVGLQACGSDGCRAELRSSAAATYALAAVRATCPDCSDHLESKRSEPVSVPAGPVSRGSGASGTGGDGDGDGLTLGGGSAAVSGAGAGRGAAGYDQAAAFARVFGNALAGGAGLPEEAAVAAPQVAPRLPDGTYGTQLPYDVVAGGPGASAPRRASPWESPDRSMQLAGSAALLLLAYGLHVVARRRPVPLDEPAGG